MRRGFGRGLAPANRHFWRFEVSVAKRREEMAPQRRRSAVSGRQPEPEVRPLWADWLSEKFDAMLDAKVSALDARISALETRLVKWQVSTMIALFSLLIAYMEFRLAG